MTIQYRTGLRAAFFCAAVAAIVFIPLANVVADESRSLADDASDVNRQRLYSRANYVWPYETGPHYGNLPAPIPGRVVTPVGSFLLSNGELPIPAQLRTGIRLGELDAQYFIVQTLEDSAVREDVNTLIVRSGGAVVSFMPGGAAIARLNREGYQSLKDAPGVTVIEPFHAAFKLHPGIGRQPLADPVKALSNVYVLSIQLWDGEDAETVAGVLANMGANVLGLSTRRIRVEAERSLLTEIARLEPVALISERVPVYPAGEETTTVMQTGEYNEGAIPYHDAGIDGGGNGFGFCAAPDPAGTGCDDDGDCAGSSDCVASVQILGVIDSGLQLDAGDLSDTRVDAGTPGIGHRKVRVYETTNQFGGSGDLLGCDDSVNGALTHGHMVSATALGNGTAVPPGYGQPWFALDQQGNPWKLDGLAPRAVVVMYDADITPPAASCVDPLLGNLDVGDLWDDGDPTGSGLGKAYAEGARIMNLSFGADVNEYSADTDGTQAVDDFMEDNRDALVVIAAGNNGNDVNPNDGIPDRLTLNDLATSKNGLVVGASRTSDTTVQVETRAFFSSVGPAVDTGTINRIAPHVMAPGDENAGGVQGVSSEYSCLTTDNNQTNPVECDVLQGVEGTSFSSAAAAGAALLVRDYFAQGFYPKKTPNTDDQIETISGALVRAVIASSADFMSGANLTDLFRWNNEQGYGRIQLDNAIPITNWPPSPSGMLAQDTLNGVVNLPLGLQGSLLASQTTSTSFEVCNAEEELRFMLSWTDFVEMTGGLINDLNLRVISPSGKEYRGNYFSDDNNRNGVIDSLPDEDCPAIGDTDVNGTIDEGQWSLPTCTNTGVPGIGNVPTPFDSTNTLEGIFLSPDPDNNQVLQDGMCGPNAAANPNGLCGNDLDCGFDSGAPDPDDRCAGGTQQPELGDWTVFVEAGSGNPTAQDYSLVIVGGVCPDSNVSYDAGFYTCNGGGALQKEVDPSLEGGAIVIVTEKADPGDASCTAAGSCPAAVIEGRTTVRAFDEADVEVDCEGPGCIPASAGLTFVNTNGLNFRSTAVEITDGTVPEPGNGTLDVRDGYRVQVNYADSDGDRVSSAAISCRVAVGFGSAVFVQFGQDTSTLVTGGCERAERRSQMCVAGVCQGSGQACTETANCPKESQGFFEFGFPDRYMDADELIHFNFAFSSEESIDLENVVAGMRCVSVDQDSPNTCLPSGAGCDPAECGGLCDPRRLNNPTCPWMTILDSPKFLGFLPQRQVFQASFTLDMADSAVFGNQTPTVELLLEVTADTFGKTASGLIVDRQRLNVDATALEYNTDFPAGGIAIDVRDVNNNEIAEDPVTDLVGFQGLDYRFETKNYSDLTAGLDESGAPVVRNAGLQSPWNFDGGKGGFVNGLNSTTNESNAQANLIANWGEDKNFNGIEDGVCVANPAIACYDFTGDPRCPGIGLCQSVENNNTDSVFTQNYNTTGGCGWQTLAPLTCNANPSRSCFVTADCAGTCQLPGNGILSSFDSCGAGVGISCDPVLQCDVNAGATQNILQSCDDGMGNPDQAFCGGAGCASTPQICVGDGGSCTGGAATTGGAWHTGIIRPVDQGNCDTQCANFKTITTTGGTLIWWELLLTPVLEKVDQSIGGDGLPNSRAEIVDFAWNASTNLADNNASYTWEFDTDLATIFPVDLISDGTVLGTGAGGYGAVSGENNPDLTNGFNVFANVGSCKATTGVCTDDVQCPPGGECLGLGSCTIDGADCTFDGDCSDVCTGDGITTCDADSDCAEGDPAPGGDCEPIQTCTPSAADGTDCTLDSECTAIDADATCRECVQSTSSLNGSDPQGNNRNARNSCFFEGVGKIRPETVSRLGPPTPFDDDIDQDLDGLIDEYVTAAGPIRNSDVVSFNGPDMRLFTLEDLFGDTGNTFQGSIGFLNAEGTNDNPALQSFGTAIDDVVVAWQELVLAPDNTSCASGSCATLAVPTGALFEGDTLIPISLLDAFPTDSACVGGSNNNQLCTPAAGGSDCPGGMCVGNAGNDCDLNGIWRETPLEIAGDCDGNSVPDRVILATSPVEAAGEIVVLNQSAPGGSEFSGVLTTSVITDNPGVLFIGQVGIAVPVVTLTYNDSEDGTGSVCQNNVIADQQGLVQAAITVTITAGDVQILGATNTDNGDGDGTPDSDETITLDFQIKNNAGVNLTNCIVRLSSNSPTVECIPVSSVNVGDLPCGSVTSSGGCSNPPVPAPGSFVYKISGAADRTSLGLSTEDDLSVVLNFSVQCTETDGTLFPQSASFPLDFNINDFAQTPTFWVETFEGAATLGDTKVGPQDNDLGIPGNSNVEGLINGEGWRCQFNDPDWVNGSAYGRVEALNCYPAQTLSHSQKIYWQLDGEAITASPDGGRAKSGTQSMYYGVFLPPDSDDPLRFTTQLATVEGAGTIDPINLGSQSPTIVFWHQISVLDHREVGARAGRAADRVTWQIQVADRDSGDAAGPWTTLQPVQNSYDIQSESNFFNCLFDPIDDGNTDNDFFDAGDPQRSTGPSSTCFPTFVYSWLGDTDEPFMQNNVGRATTPPEATDSPSLGIGTWVETVTDLSAFRGRRARFRWIGTSLKAGTAETINGLFGNQNEGDDGWWIDDVFVDEVLPTPALFVNDDGNLGTCSVSEAPCVSECQFTFVACTAGGGECSAADGPCVLPCGAGEGTCSGPAPDCGANCTTVTANVFITPDETLNPGSVGTAAPGQVITLNAAAAESPSTPASTPSVADACQAGILQYQYCVSGDPDGGGPGLPDDDCDDPVDELIRTWTANSVATVAPQVSQSIVTEVRCSSLTTCVGSEKTDVVVSCPGGVNANGLLQVAGLAGGTLAWTGAPLGVNQWTSAEFSQVGEGGVFGTYAGSVATLGPTTSVSVAGDAVAAGAARGYLFRAVGSKNTVADGYFCNSRSYRSGSVSETAELGRDAFIAP